MVFRCFRLVYFDLCLHNLRRRHYTESAQPSIQFCWKCGDIGRTSWSLIFCLILAAFVGGFQPKQWIVSHNRGNCRDGGLLFPFFYWFIKTAVLFTLLKVSKHIYLIYWPHFQFVSCRLVSTEMFRVSSNITIVMVVAWWDRSLLVRGLVIVIYISYGSSLYKVILPRTEFVIAVRLWCFCIIRRFYKYIEVEYLSVALNFFRLYGNFTLVLRRHFRLFDHIADLFKFDDSLLSRTKTTLVTFFTAIIDKPAISMDLWLLLRWIGATIWAVIVPALAAKEAVKNSTSKL